MTPMIWLIWLEELSIACIADTASRTITPEISESPLAARTTSEARRAPERSVHRGYDLAQGGGRFLQRGGLLLGATRQVNGARADASIVSAV